MPDLELVSTNDLVDELKRRFDHGAVGLLREDKKNSDGSGDLLVVARSWGNALTAIGLTQRVAHNALAAFLETEVDSPED